MSQKPHKKRFKKIFVGILLIITPLIFAAVGLLLWESLERAYYSYDFLRSFELGKAALVFFFTVISLYGALMWRHHQTDSFLQERKVAERKAKEAEDRYRTIFENSAVAITVVDEQERLISWNKFAEWFLGMDKKDLFLKPVKELYPPEEWSKIRTYNIRQQGLHHRIETKVIRKSGEIVEVDLSLSVLRDPDGKVTGSIGIISDSSERSALESMRRRYEFIVNTSKRLMTLINRNYVYEAVNDAYLTSHDKKRGDVVGKTVSEIWGEETFHAGIRKYIDECFSGKEVSYGAWVDLPKVGKRFFEVNYYPYYSSEWTVSHAVVVSQDITERKLAEEGLEASREQFRVLIQTIPDIIYELDPEGKFLFVSDAIRQLGYEPEQIIGMHYKEILHPDDYSRVSRDAVLPHFRGKVTGDVASPKLFDERRTDGRMTMNLEVRLALKGEEGEAVGYRFAEVHSSGKWEKDEQGHNKNFISTIGVIRDITERKHTEQKLEEQKHDLQEAYAQLKKQSFQLAQAEKMGALGIMAAGLAHELNNPMMGILNFVEYCLKHTPPEDKRHGVLKDAHSEVKQCMTIIQDVLAFSRREDSSDEGYQMVSCGDILERVLRLLTYRVRGENVAITQDVAGDVPPIPMKPSNMQQVFLNIINNALDAVKESQHREIHITVKREEKFVRTTIADTGPGIKQEIVQKIFDPFFTTKGVGKGTGLGLSICYSIVTAHQGVITCDSKPGEGVVFTILLPLTREKKEG